MVAHPKPPRLSVQAYLEQEESAETKSEYFDGVIVAMAGASPSHVRIIRILWISDLARRT